MVQEEKIRRCTCALEAIEFSFGLDTISDKIGEVRVHAPYKLSPDLIKLHRQVADIAIEHLQNVRKYCDIDIEEERKRFIKVRKNLSQINDPEGNIKLSDDLTFIATGIRTKLHQCKEGKS